jgi:hypothetical protein
MKFQKNDHVQLTRDYNVKKGTIPEGSTGVIRRVLSKIFCYEIDFKEPFTGIIVPESNLKSAQ